MPGIGNSMLLDSQFLEFSRLKNIESKKKVNKISIDIYYSSILDKNSYLPFYNKNCIKLINIIK